MDDPLPEPVSRAVGALPAGYLELVSSLVSSCRADQRVRALWLAGSLGRGTADLGSDLDVIVTLADAVFDDFCTGWRAWLATITPTIIAREIPGVPGSFFSVTEGCQRFDAVFERVGDVASHSRGDRMVILDRDGLAARLLDPPQPTAAGPDPGRMAAVVEEFFRQQAIFPAAVVARQDWLLGVVGVVGSQRLLYDLLVESNQPLPTLGVKQWSARLTPGQRELLEALPVPGPRPDQVVPAMFAVRRAMLSIGRETAERCGVAWPLAMDAAVAAYYAKELGSSSVSTASDGSAASALSTSPTTRIESPGG